MVNDKLIENPLEVASEFNKFFSSVAFTDSHVVGSSNQRVQSRTPVSSMVLLPVDESEVASVVRRLKPKRTCDANGMSVWLLKQCMGHILVPLTKLINLSFEKGIFPSLLKTAKIVPVHKKGDVCTISHYRPIAILPVISKVFEKLFCNRLINYLDRFEILCPEQFGFRKQKSTIDAVINLIEDVVDGLERREQVLSVFIDLSKAFDCVHHEKLLHQLELYGIRDLPLMWLTSYLSDRSQCVQIADTLSSGEKMPFGVPQGSILGPILFLIYVNGLSSVIHNGKLIQFADDTTLCFRANSKQCLEVNAFLELNSCIQYFSNLHLKTNNSKTNLVNFCLKKKENEYRPVILVDDGIIDDSESVTFLGMLLDRGLTWDAHVDSVCSKVSSGIFGLRNLAQFSTPDVLKMAYFGLIHPYLTYGLLLWGSSSKSNIERVFRAQKKAVRIMTKLNKRESCRDAFRELGLLTLPCLYVLQICLYCRFHCETITGGDVHQYGTRGRDNLRVAKHRTVAFEHLPQQVGVKIIHRLPGEIKQIENKKLFKARLKCLLASRVFYSVDEFMQCRWD